MLRFVLIACVVALAPLHSRAYPAAEIEENDFLDFIIASKQIVIVIIIVTSE